MVILSVYLFNNLFDYNLLKNRTVVRKLSYVFELHRFVLHRKNCYCIVTRYFYGVLKKFQYINIFYLFLMTQIGMKFWYVFKLHRSDLHTKISHCIQYMLFYRTLQEFKYIYCSFLMTQIGTKFWYVFKLHRSDLNTKVSRRIQHYYFTEHYKNLSTFTVLF